MSKTKNNQNLFLEVKSASFSSKQWQATFNDTTYEKAQAFKTDILFLCLSIWQNASDLLFLVFGKNPQIGSFLEDKITHFKNGKTVRSTQSISIQKLIFDYNFKILNIGKEKEEILQLLRLKNKKFNKLDNNCIINISDFTKIQDYF